MSGGAKGVMALIALRDALKYAWAEEYLIKDPFIIAGQSTAITQIGYGIERILENSFPVDDIPWEYTAAAHHLCDLLLVAEQEIVKVVLLLRKDGK